MISSLKQQKCPDFRKAEFIYCVYNIIIFMQLEYQMSGRLRMALTE